MYGGLDSLYDDIGSKIKSWAKGVFAVEVAVSIVAVVFLFVASEYWEWWYFLILFGGPFVAWVSSWLLYGFGEIIDKLCAIEKNTRSPRKVSEEQMKVDSARMDQLERLRAQGLISEEEYRQAASKNQ